jgi:hypothetical protein
MAGKGRAGASTNMNDDVLGSTASSIPEVESAIEVVRRTLSSSYRELDDPDLQPRALRRVGIAERGLRLLESQVVALRAGDPDRAAALREHLLRMRAELEGS